MPINFAGFLYDKAGDAINGATVNLYDRNTTTPAIATTTTNSNGYFTIARTPDNDGTDRYDVEFVFGDEKRRRKYDDELQCVTLEVANFRLRNPADTYVYDILPSAITADRNLTLPLITAADTVAVLALAQTFLTGVKTFNSSILAIRNPADTFSYTIVAAAITAARNLTIPLITANDTLAVLGLAQTFTAAQTFQVGADNPITVTQNENGAAVLVATLQGERSVPADGDAARVSLNLNNASAASTAFARIGWVASTVADATSTGAFVIDLRNSNVVQEHFRFVPGHLRFPTGAAVTATEYSIGRDTAATNRLNLNVPTGASALISVNGVLVFSVSATSMSYQASNAGGTLLFDIRNQSNTAGSIARLLLNVAGGSAGNPDLQFEIEGAERVAIGLDNAVANRFTLSQGSALGTNDRVRLDINTGILDIDGTSALTAAVVGLFDELDDALVLRSLLWGEFGLISEEQRLENRQVLYKHGVLTPKDSEHDPNDPTGYFISVQPMIHLLAGGIYQTRMALDSWQEKASVIFGAHEDRLDSLENENKMLRAALRKTLKGRI